MTLCLVTDRRRRPVIAQCRDAVSAGIDLVQLREPDLEAGALAELASALVEIARGTLTRIVVNDRIDVAMACHAHGVHLRGDSIPPARARTMTPPGFLIGRSVRTVQESLSAAAGADYLIAGTVFETTSKPGLQRHLGVEGLAAIAGAARLPVLAIGGMSVDRVEAVARAGAAGVAAIGLFDAGGQRLAAAVREVRRRFDSARSAS